MEASSWASSGTLLLDLNMPTCRPERPPVVASLDFFIAEMWSSVDSKWAINNPKWFLSMLQEELGPSWGSWWWLIGAG